MSVPRPTFALRAVGLIAGLALTLAITACGGGASSPTKVSFEGGFASDTGKPDHFQPTPPDARDSGHEASLDAEPDQGAGDAGLADTGSDSGATGFVAAPHTLPTIPDQGGPVLSHPVLVTVTYANDPQRTFVEQLGAYLVTSPWLTAVGPEYGVGLGTQVNVELPMSAPTTITDAEIQALVESLVVAGTAPDADGGVLAKELPPESDGGFDAGPDAWDGGGDGGPPVLMPQYIYMMYFPPTTAVLSQGELICDFSGGGYHFQTSLATRGQAFAYAVVTECPSSTQEELVQTSSHEFIEASTDPSQGDLAYSITDLYDPYSYFGGEVGDLCSLLSPQWSEGGFNGIQRVYSDKSVAAGGDPCLPSSAPYFGTNVVPATAKEVTPGGQAVFAITGWSSAPVTDWELSAAVYIASPVSFAPGLNVSTSTLNNGGAATLTVDIPAGAGSGTYALILLFSAYSQTDYTSSLLEIYVP